jgi:hypothetical protein
MKLIFGMLYRQFVFFGIKELQALPHIVQAYARLVFFVVVLPMRMDRVFNLK